MMNKSLKYRKKKDLFKQQQLLTHFKAYLQNRYQDYNVSLLSLYPFKFLINPATKIIYRYSLTAISQISLNKLINVFMNHGKKSKVESQFNRLLYLFKFNNVYHIQHIIPAYLTQSVPALGLRKVRKGSLYYSVPFILIPYHQVGLVFRWLKSAVNSLAGKVLFIRLFIELSNLVFQRKTGILKQRGLLHKQVLNNRAFSHFRWI